MDVIRFIIVFGRVDQLNQTVNLGNMPTKLTYSWFGVLQFHPNHEEINLIQSKSFIIGFD